MRNQRVIYVLQIRNEKKFNKLFCEEIKVGDKVILREHYEKLGYFKNSEFIVSTIEGEIVNEKFK